MSDADRTLTQSMAENYENLLGSVLFAPMAPFTADAVTRGDQRDIVETAAGTVILTRLLAERLPDSQIVATDLSQPMLDYGASIAPAANVGWLQADAQEVPLDGDEDEVIAAMAARMLAEFGTGDGDTVEGRSQALVVEAQ